jgi:hypothetical protein
MSTLCIEFSVPPTPPFISEPIRHRRTTRCRLRNCCRRRPRTRRPSRFHPRCRDGPGEYCQASSAQTDHNLLLRHSKRGVVAWRRDDARTHCVHPNLAFLEVYGPGARKRADRSLGRAVDAEGRTAGAGNHRCIQYDRSSPLQQRERLLHCKQQSPHVHVKLLVA